MAKTSGGKSEEKEPHFRVTLTMTTVVSASALAYGKQSPKTEEEALKLLKEYDSNAVSSTYCLNLWTDEATYEWEVEVTKVHRA